MKKWDVVAILCLAQFVMVLDSTVMNVSISQVVADLGTTVSGLQTAITFYTLTMAAFMLIGAKLCAKLGLLRAFAIGSVVYGAGSLLTGMSQNITQLFIGWSVIEGLGAVLVIPAIASLVAVNYKGKDRVVAFALIGGISGAAAAAGPLIGGYVTTYLSWRYVFIAETVVMAIVLLLSRRFKATAPTTTEKLDVLSCLLSVSGMTLLVYGMLQSKVWGWIEPMAQPAINGHEIAPLGISICAYLIIGGIVLLKLFYDRQGNLEKARRNPLLHVSMLSIKSLKAGLSVLMSQYTVIAAVFFVVPVYLQMVIGLDALETGMRILPLSVALILFSVLGTKMTLRRSPKQIIRIGQVLLVVGIACLLHAINPELTGYAFATAMFAVGAGLGLLASQLGNINMSSVSEDKTSEAGGLQGVFQNLGSSFGTAFIGSVLVGSLTTSFITNVNNSSLPDNVKNYVAANSKTGVDIVPVASVESYAINKGATNSEAAQISSDYADAQMAGLKEAITALAIIATLSLLLSRNIPSEKPLKTLNKARATS
jgi:MFS family permease